MKPTIYFSHPIRGIAGRDASLRYIQDNCERAVEVIEQLKEYFPDVEWYCPAEHDRIIQILYLAKKLSWEDIMWADERIIESCQGLLAYRWERSRGVDREVKFADKIGIPYLEIKKLYFEHVWSDADTKCSHFVYSKEYKQIQRLVESANLMYLAKEKQ